MPVYEFRCPKCDYQFDKLSPIVSDQPQPCPKCGEPAPQIMSRPSPFQWGRGGGWN